MAKSSGLSQNFYLAGYDLSGDVGAINNCSSPRTVLDVTAINKAAIERLMRLSDAQLEFAAWFNDASGQEHLALRGLPTADVVVVWAMGTTLGDSAVGLVAKQVNYDGSRGQDGSLALTVSCLADGIALEWGDMLTAGIDTHTGATDGTSIDDAAGTSDGIVGYIHAPAFNGTDVTVVIQESSDNGAGDAWTTKLSFTQITVVNASERKTATGAVERYVRVSSSGTFTSVDIAVMYRRGNTNDDTPY